MTRIDVHCHFLPDLDDGCRTLDESLQCLRMMVAAGYTRLFCTPHCGASEFSDLSTNEVALRVHALSQHIKAHNIPIEIRPGGELRLSPLIADDLPEESGGPGIPTYGHAGKYVLADLWEDTWPAWANRAVEWLQHRGHTVIIAHPERMPAMRTNPNLIQEIAKTGALFQGNLGPIAGADSRDIVSLAHQFLQDGRYFMVATDGHRPSHLEARLKGLQQIESLVGKEKLEELTVTNPARLWS